MHYFYILMISLANNIDNIGVRIAYSILGIKIGFLKNLWISVITFIISMLAAFCGNAISSVLSTQIAAIISALILSGIGLWIIFSPYIKKNSTTKSDGKNLFSDILDNPEKADLDCSKDIDFKEATLLGISCSLNNIGGGLGAGMMGLNPLYVGIFSAIISFLALWAGNYITDFIQNWQLGNKATIIAGVCIILIGLKQVIFIH